VKPETWQPPWTPRLPAGPWKAHLELKSGLLTESADATLTFPAGPGTSTAPITAEPAPGLLWTAVGIGLAVPLLLLAL